MEAAGSIPSGERPIFDLPSNGWRPGMPSRAACLDGRFRAVRHGDQVEAWLGGRRGWHTWPEGWRVRFDPVELIDPNGRVVARAGEMVRSAGGLMSDEAARRQFGADKTGDFYAYTDVHVDGPLWTGPTPVMVQALGLVQDDLDVAGLDRFQLSYARVHAFPANDIVVNVQWRGTWTTPGIDIEIDNLLDMAVEVGAHTAQGLVELEQVYWPTCPIHGVRARAVLDSRHEAAWRCKQRGSSTHIVARIGDLVSVPSRRGQSPVLWRTLDHLATP
jgi:hypothetical protein